MDYSCISARRRNCLETLTHIVFLSAAIEISIVFAVLNHLLDNITHDFMDVSILAASISDKIPISDSI